MFCWDSIPIYFRINSFIYFVIWNIRTLLKNFCKSSCLVHANEVFFRYVICCSMECRKLSNFYRKNSLSVREPSPLSHTQNERTSKVVSYNKRMITLIHANHVKTSILVLLCSTFDGTELKWTENHRTSHLPKLQLNCNKWRYHVYIVIDIQINVGRSYLDNKNFFLFY